MRSIVLDTETTGLDPKSGHRIVEIGCVEIYNAIPSGRTFHTYINPERDIPEIASSISGITYDMVRDAPVFAKIVDDFLTFIGESPLVIHNAKFDMGFINHELQIIQYPCLPMSRSIDTVAMAKQIFPGAQASLDALCRRFDIDLSQRVKHGALIDAQLLADVYLNLLGGRQHAFHFKNGSKRNEEGNALDYSNKIYRAPRPFAFHLEEEQLHATMLLKIKTPLWGFGSMMI